MKQNPKEPMRDVTGNEKESSVCTAVMNLESLQRKLIAVARAVPADERVPYAFEKRIMARLAEATHIDLVSAWSSALWRAAVCCVAVVLLSSAWSLWTAHQQSKADFSREFDTAVFASVASVDDVQ